MARLYLAIPQRFKLSQSELLIPQLAKCDRLSWKYSSFDSTRLDRYCGSWCGELGLAGTVKYMSCIGKGSAKCSAFFLHSSTAFLVSGLNRVICVRGSNLPRPGREPSDAVTLNLTNQSAIICTIVSGGRMILRIYFP